LKISSGKKIGCFIALVDPIVVKSIISIWHHVVTFGYRRFFESLPFVAKFGIHLGRVVSAKAGIFFKAVFSVQTK